MESGLSYTFNGVKTLNHGNANVPTDTDTAYTYMNLLRICSAYLFLHARLSCLADRECQENHLAPGVQGLLVPFHPVPEPQVILVDQACQFFLLFLACQGVRVALGHL